MARLLIHFVLLLVCEVIYENRILPTYYYITYIFVVPALNFKRSIYYGSGKIWHLGNSVLFCCYIILKFYYTYLKAMQYMYMYSFLVLLLTTLLYMLHNTEKKVTPLWCFSTGNILTYYRNPCRFTDKEIWLVSENLLVGNGVE